LLERHAAWTGRLNVFEELRENVERALAWMADYGDGDGDGYIEYQSTSEKGLINQGWKDSGDAIINAEGKLAHPPIALVEVQGYAYQAKLAVAALFRRAGEVERAERLEKEAQELRARFNRDFWMSDRGFYTLALQADKQPCAVLSSNPGHALWSGIADADKARQTAERLMADDLFSGWGIRTLSAQERGFNPLSYHRGTVWPHDNALIAAGLRRYGFDDATHRIFKGLVEAASYFAHGRLPELFSGFSRQEYGVPVAYPVACHPQAWAAGTIPYLVDTMLGLVPEAFERRLRIVRPTLPDFVDRLEVRGLRVAEARTDLRFTRTAGGGVEAKVVNVHGALDVAVEPAS
jgi:glycogen debranching enzyme